MRMSLSRWFAIPVFIVLLAGGVPLLAGSSLPGSARLDNVRERRVPDIKQAMQEKGFTFGAPVFIRIFKQEHELEVWLERDGRYSRYENFPICSYSGELGPKLKEGDRQSPEGFYTVTRSALNPNSRYHLSFNLGFPNAYDRSHGRTGSYLMVHGNCVSIGCYAMTNGGIEDIYLMVEAALGNGQRAVPVHIFPFRMEDAMLDVHAGSPWADFWRNLKTGHDYFENHKVPPRVSVVDKQYVVSDAN